MQEQKASPASADELSRNRSSLLKRALSSLQKNVRALLLKKPREEGEASENDKQ
jgi:hypothetical protein